MSVSSAIFDRLSDPTSATAALVGSGSTCRVYPELAPNLAAKPYVVFLQIALQPANTLNEPFEVANRLFQFSCFAATFGDAIALRDAVTSDLDNVALSTGDIPIVQDQRNGFEEVVDLYRADVDFLV